MTLCNLPVIISIDDIQWMDYSSFEIIIELQNNIKNNIFYAFASRPPQEITNISILEFIESIIQITKHNANQNKRDLLRETESIHADHIEKIALEPLSEDVCEILFCRNFSTLLESKGKKLGPFNKIEENFKKKVHHLTSGNPMIIQILVQEILDKISDNSPFVIENNTLSVSDDWEQKFWKEIIPSDKGSRSAVVYHMDSVHPVMKHILRIASVAGLDFYEEEVTAVLKKNPI
ncbi:hypothetical protein HK096_000869, partial [Nowakowskiella sp. JEL0078]